MPGKKSGRQNNEQASESASGSDKIDLSDIEKLDVSTLKLLITKIETLSTEVTTGFRDIKQDINDLKALEQSVKDASDTAHEAKKSTENNAEEINFLKCELSETRRTVKSLEYSCQQLKQDHTNLDAYIRRDNLKFLNIPDEDDKSCEQLVREFMVTRLHMTKERVSAIKIVRCHRLRSGPGEIKPIICRFHFFGDRQEVWGKRSELPKGSKMKMHEDFPQDIISRRNVLMPIMLEARRQNKYANLVADRLVIDHVNYTIHTLDKLPPELDPSKFGTKKVNGNITAFFGALSPLSNFYEAPFKDKHNILYKHSEQYLQYRKALLFDDEITAAKILASSSPGECKSLGNRIPKFEAQKWERSAKLIMMDALMYKFKQNPKCLDTLKATGNATLAEASRRDNLWGIGMSIDDKDIAQQAMWGQNWMGELLEIVRGKLNQ